MSARSVPVGQLADRRADFGMWVFLATELMFFGPMLLGYWYGRISFGDAFAAASRETEVLLGGINTAVLLSSSALMACAVDALADGRKRAARRLLFATAALGVIFLGIKGYEYWHDVEKGLLPGAGSRFDSGERLFFLLYYAMTGVHALHLLIGVCVALTFAFGLGRGVPALAEPRRLRVAGLYWHFVDSIWILLYPILYLVGRAQ